MGTHLYRKRRCKRISDKGLRLLDYEGCVKEQRQGNADQDLAGDYCWAEIPVDGIKRSKQ